MIRFAGLLALTAATHFAHAGQPDASGAYAFELPKGKVHEVCLRIEAGQTRAYEWSGDAPADFNIHYHRGDDVFYPVKRDATRAEKGTFTAKTGEDYCWMWTAKAPMKVRGTIR